MTDEERAIEIPVGLCVMCGRVHEPPACPEPEPEESSDPDDFADNYFTRDQ